MSLVVYCHKEVTYRINEKIRRYAFLFVVEYLLGKCYFSYLSLKLF